MDTSLVLGVCVRGTSAVFVVKSVSLIRKVNISALWIGLKINGTSPHFVGGSENHGIVSISPFPLGHVRAQLMFGAHNTLASPRAFTFRFHEQVPQLALVAELSDPLKPIHIVHLLRAAQKIKAKRRLVKNCADRNLIGWDEKKWQWAVNIAVSLTVMEELFRVFISVKAAVTHCQDTRLSKSPAMKMLPL